MRQSMDNPEEDAWRMAWMDWVRQRRRCQAHRLPTEEGTLEKRLMEGGLFLVVTLVTCAVTTVCVLECWRSGDGEDRVWNGAKGEVLNMVGKEIDIQLSQFKPDLHFTLQASSGIEETGEGNLSGWRNAYYSLLADREFVATSSAYYMIYTCLSFVAPPSESDVTYWQEVWRQSRDGDDKRLMVDAQSERCNNNNSHSESEMIFCRRSIIVVTLRLRIGDRIYIKTNYRHLVGRRNGTSYFGVVKMS